jgi:uncharacterized protein YdaU (DUF1376 family)
MAMPWFPCYPSDLLGSLRWQMMTPEERGAYWQLLCLCYQSANGKIMAPLYLLSRMSGIDLEQHPLVLEAFQQDEDGAWFNERAYSEWLKRQEVSEKRTEAGVKGAANLWQMPTHPHPHPHPESERTIKKKTLLRFRERKARKGSTNFGTHTRKSARRKPRSRHGKSSSPASSSRIRSSRPSTDRLKILTGIERTGSTSPTLPAGSMLADGKTR